MKPGDMVTLVEELSIKRAKRYKERYGIEYGKIYTVKEYKKGVGLYIKEDKLNVFWYPATWKKCKPRYKNFIEKLQSISTEQE